MKHPCHGKTDVTASTCYDFHLDWIAGEWVAGMAKRKGLTYGRAFLDLYLPDVVDDELATATAERAHEIVLARYMANR